MKQLRKMLLNLTWQRKLLKHTPLAGIQVHIQAPQLGLRGQEQGGQGQAEIDDDVLGGDILDSQSNEIGSVDGDMCKKDLFKPLRDNFYSINIQEDETPKLIMMWREMMTKFIPRV